MDTSTDEDIPQLIAKVEAALAIRNSEDQAALTRLEAQVAAISKKVADIANVIAAATASAEMDEHDGMIGGRDESPLSLREWIESESKALGLPIRQSVVIRAQWLATRRVSDTYVAIDFSANVVAVDDTRQQNAPRLPSFFRVDMVRADDDFLRIAPGRPLGFVCRLTSGGRWSMEIFSIGESGSATPLLPSRIF
ncbi:hypothetical protein [Paraburkholderia fungorum]|uniref:hypothetical protein n=1 Tax=Paraburkholderia fungorum TaxID=134537 RepID=UPI0011EA663B|nr:hypothetical protein [Paraburkholderia fungorum]